jgi:hypothetical protein
MAIPRQRPSLIHDPLGLLALPVVSIGPDGLADECPQPGTNSAAIAAKTIGGALVAVLIVVSLVALPGPQKRPQMIPHCHLESG